jgi:hypothetical protein
MTAVVGVHGVGQYRSGETVEQARTALNAAWHKHLRRGELGGLAGRLDIEVTYYAHQLRPAGVQGAADRLDELDPDAEQMLRDWLAEFDLPDSVPQGPGTVPLRHAISWIARTKGLGPIATERFVATFFREVATYLRRADSPARTAARQTVADTIRAHKPRIVLAHSLGSVVTYETLCAHPELSVDLLVTLGSPLALPHAIFPRLHPAPVDGRGHPIPNVRTWINLADPGDLVAIPPRGLSRHFAGVDVDDYATIHAFDFHLAANYLACRTLARHLAPLLRA